MNSIPQKRRVLVTGASRGIGRACALQLAKQGFQIGVHYNSRNDLAEEVTEEINDNGGTAVTLKFDVADRQAAYESLTKDTMSNGAFYGVVCNAGIAQDNAFPAMSGDEWDYGSSLEGNPSRPSRTHACHFHGVRRHALLSVLRIRMS